jgi:acyl-CoA thioester hydrolase
MDPAEALGRYPVSVTIPVAWGEMDAFQHVNNVVFARWMETARMTYLERIGFDRQTSEGGTGPILARTVLDYRLPVTYPDRVRVDATVTRIGKSSFTMGLRIFSEAQQAVAASGEQVMVVYDYAAGKTAPVDDALRAAIARLERGG